MALRPAYQDVLGTEMMKFGLGGIWTDGGTIIYGGVSPTLVETMNAFHLIRQF